MVLEIKVNNKDKVLEEFKKQCEVALLMCGEKAKAYSTNLCPVDTGMLRQSINTNVTMLPNGGECHLGTNMEYAAYVELGTGKYAKSGGRQTAWVYQDAKGNWHYTNGQKPQPYLKPAIADHAKEYFDIIKKTLKG